MAGGSASRGMIKSAILRPCAQRHDRHVQSMILELSLRCCRTWRRMWFWDWDLDWRATRHSLRCGCCTVHASVPGSLYVDISRHNGLPIVCLRRSVLWLYACVVTHVSRPSNRLPGRCSWRRWLKPCTRGDLWPSVWRRSGAQR